ncbi:NLP/P60 domain-containing protein [Salmonella enterica subsp. enterica]|uniref:NLP/P60 domain-containing protein n=1 Tax=Salmonella enterica I TaxID=59201 RepID=A0A379WRR0_SALET|nr:NLP/P60 domain-containing protein [Salmonella enterica subsp. enterica]
MVVRLSIGLAKRNEFTAMPWKMTPENIAVLMKAMHGAPYGWGNFNFYNDCSAEVRSLLMPFGIFLPRHSSAQVESAGRGVDLSHKNPKCGSIISPDTENRLLRWSIFQGILCCISVTQP